MSIPAGKNGFPPIHPGEFLREDYLKPLNMSVNALAKALGVPSSRINDIVRERRGITADTALRLAAFFGGGAQEWLRLQADYDLKMAQRSSNYGFIRPFKQEILEEDLCVS